MTIKAPTSDGQPRDGTNANPLSFLEIESEFGQTGNSLQQDRSLGQYRTQHSSRENTSNPLGLFANASPTGSSLSNLPLDSGMPTVSEIKFSDFYNKKLNIIIDYFNDNPALNRQDNGDNTMAATWRYKNQSNDRVRVVGGFRSRPDITLTSSSYNATASATEWQGGKQIIMNINQAVGGKKGNRNFVALRTGGWPTNTSLTIDVGSTGVISGAGGDGGRGTNYSTTGGDGGDGTSALGVEYPATINRATNGIIRCGYGGGGGGGGAGNDPSDKSNEDHTYIGGGGGGGAGRPAGKGGTVMNGGVGSISGNEDPYISPDYDGKPGGDGNLIAGGSGGFANDRGGADAGEGGDGGDKDSPLGDAFDGEDGQRDDSRAYGAAGGGEAGEKGYGIIYNNNTTQSNSSGNGTSIPTEQGGVVVGNIL